MGRVLLVGRLAARDLRRHPATAVLMLLAIVAATTTLTLGLALHGTTSHPYDTTRTATAGPDVVAQATLTKYGAQGPLPVDLAGLDALSHAAGVTASSGPYPYTFAALTADGRTVSVMVEGRDQTPSAVDRPDLTAGHWIRPGEVVVERTFADTLGLTVGDTVTLGGRSYLVAGIAVTAAIPPYPGVCWLSCYFGPGVPRGNLPGLIWATRSTARSLAIRTEPLSYLLNLRIANPAEATAFADAYNATHRAPNAPYLMSWQAISAQDGVLVANEQRILSTASWLLGVLAVASVAVLVGGRMTEQTRRVGLLKAVGSTPKLVAAVLLAEHLAVALVAAAIGLLAGWLIAPLLASPGAGLVGTAGTPPVGLSTVGLVIAVALGVAVLATFVPAVRAARMSTVAALADIVPPPKRRGWLIALSARLPAPLLLGLRLMARRPRRAVLSVVSIAITATGIVAVQVVHASIRRGIGNSSVLDNPQNNRLGQVMLVLSVALVLLAAVNAILIMWAAVLDARHAAALARALGATPQQVTAGLSAAQLLPAALGALLGVPCGWGLVEAVRNGNRLVAPPAWWLIATVLGTVAAVAVITALPAWLGASHPPAEVLGSELA
jgi:putative ABC transport system permease protein